LSIQDEDRDLVQRIADRDEEAARLFHKMHTEALFLAARSNGLAPEDCQDTVQDVLMAAIEQIRNGRFRGESSLATWLQAILRHKILDHWRGHFRKDARLVPMDAIGSLQPNDVPCSAPISPEDLDTALEVREVLTGLPDEFRSILLLNESEGWTIAEIAAMMKMRPGTVGRKLAEAKEMFRRAIAARAVGRWTRLPPGGESR
jgi:RNA polymerase sigma-70 factor (ECF subfamily)